MPLIRQYHCIIFALFLCNKHTAQSTFDTVHNFTIDQSWPDPGDALGSSVLETDSGFVVFGHQVATGWYTKPFAFLFNSNGSSLIDIEHQSSVPQHYSFGYVDPVAKTNSSLLAALTEFDDPYDSSNSLLLIQFNQAGDTSWTRIIYDSCFCGSTQTRRVAPDRIAVSGFVGYEGALFIVDTMGSLILGQTFTNTELALSVRPVTPSGYLLAGYRASGYDDHCWVMRVDSIGAEVWRRNIGGSKHASRNTGAIPTLDGGVLGACSYKPIGSDPFDPEWCYFRKWDIDGNVIWSQQYNLQLRSTPYDLEEMSNGDLIVCGAEISSTYGNNGLLFRLSPTGDLLWMRRYAHYDPSGGLSRPYDVEPTSDGGFVLTGAVQQGAMDSIPGLQMLWVLKLDSLGCLVPGCDGSSIQETALLTSLVVVPNPASDQLHVRLTLPTGFGLSGTAQLTLVDAMGRVVLETPLSRSGVLLERTVGISDLSPGIYYVHLADDRKWLAGAKVVVER